MINWCDHADAKLVRLGLPRQALVGGVEKISKYCGCYEDNGDIH